jgi:membrane protease YdiL (CAAX protease family)
MATRASNTARWPVWTVPVGLVVGAIAGQLAAIVCVLPVAPAGAGGGDVTGVALLFSSVGFGAALLATIALFVRSSGPLSARALGLRPVALRPALAWSALGAALIAAFVFFVAQIADLSDLFGVPSELDGRSSLAEELQVVAPAARADVGVGALASALARVVVPAIVAELVLRGFALQTLAGWRGEPAALAITALLTAAPLGFALGGPEGASALLPIALVLGAVLGLLYLVTSSLLPGIALSAAVMGAGLGESFAWSASGVALLSAGCCAAALAIAAPLAARAA